MRLLALLLFSLLISVQAQAVDDKIHTIGIGATICAEWLTWEGKSIELVTISWVQGYLSSYNTTAVEANEELADISFVTNEYILREIESFCKENEPFPLGFGVDKILSKLPRH